MSMKPLLKLIFKLTAILSFCFWHGVLALPHNGQVALGNAAISQSANQVTVNQSSAKIVINWGSFNTASNETVLFNQPNSSAIALNRINSGQPTNYAGILNANGQVWIINPNGVLFSSTAKVDVAGLLVTTHNITDANFMSGNYQFNLANLNSTAAIINNGIITIEEAGVAALVAPTVMNNGVIVANLGKVALSTGTEFVLDLYGDNLINFGTSVPISNGSISNTGLISATGGKVFMTANSAAKVVDNVVSMSGVIEATTATTGQYGEIILNGGNSGTVKVSGKLDASTGGSIETSGYNLNLSGAKINAGVGGTWTFDPPNLYTNLLGTLISDQLNLGTNVTLSTGVSGSGTGDVFVNAPISWSTSAILMIGAYHDITITAPITSTNNGGLIIRADLTANGNGTINFSGAGSITVDGPNGYARLYYNPTGGNYSAPNNYFPYFLGNSPIQVAYMMINTQADLIAASVAGALSNLNNYSLNNDINGSVFTSPIFGAGVVGSIDGHDYATGLNHVIYNINMTVFGNMGILGGINLGRVENLSITTCPLADCSTGFGGNSLTSTFSGVGGFFYENDGTLSHDDFRGVINSNNQLGGLAAQQQGGVIEYSFTAGSFTSTGCCGFDVGGIVGYLPYGTIHDVYSSASLGGPGAEVTGGIVGMIFTMPFRPTAVLDNAYYSGFNNGLIFVRGGIVGDIVNAGGPAVISNGNLYWNIQTNNVFGGMGLFSNLTIPTTGLLDFQMQNPGSFSGFDFTNIWQMNSPNATYPYPQIIPNNLKITGALFPGAVICLGDICTLAPQPSTTPKNIPPTETFNPLTGLPVCDTNGCANLEVVTAPNNCAYSNIDLMDQQYRVKNRLLIKQEDMCTCNLNNHWAKYCKANIHAVLHDVHPASSVAAKSPSVTPPKHWWNFAFNDRKIFMR